MRFSRLLLLALTLASSVLQSQTQADPPADPPDHRDLVFYPGDTEHLGPLTRKLAANMWLDQKTIWTSPFHIGKSNASSWLALGSIIAGAVVTDRRTIHTFENRPGQIEWGDRVSNIGAAYPSCQCSPVFMSQELRRIIRRPAKPAFSVARQSSIA